jgi:hypothetical protein
MGSHDGDCVIDDLVSEQAPCGQRSLDTKTDGNSNNYVKSKQ